MTLHSKSDLATEKANLQATAMGLLARREHSQQELFNKLSVKFSEAPADLIRQILQNLIDDGLQSDERYTKAFIRSYLGKGFGPRKVCYELNRRGISQFLIEQYVNESDESWLSSLDKLWHKRFKGVAAATLQEKARQIRYLSQRGFTSEQIRKPRRPGG